jgi:hypothetical protein
MFVELLFLLGVSAVLMLVFLGVGGMGFVGDGLLFWLGVSRL